MLWGATPRTVPRCASSRPTCASTPRTRGRTGNVTFRFMYNKIFEIMKLMFLTILLLLYHRFLGYHNQIMKNGTLINSSCLSVRPSVRISQSCYSETIQLKFSRKARKNSVFWLVVGKTTNVPTFIYLFTLTWTKRSIYNITDCHRSKLQHKHSDKYYLLLSIYYAPDLCFYGIFHVWVQLALGRFLIILFLFRYSGRQSAALNSALKSVSIWS